MIYAPAEDSQLLLECVKRFSGSSALEIGVGSGIITEALQARFSLVAGSDIDIESLRFCRQRGVSAHLACCDAADAFRGGFDLIVSNPPYLPSGDTHDQISETNPAGLQAESDIAVEGGQKGIEVTVHFIKSAMHILKPCGAMLIVVSSHANLAALSVELERLGLRSEQIAERRLFFETLSVLEIRPIVR